MDKIMESASYGKAALERFGPVPENFRIYAAGWLGDKPEEWRVMGVTGAEFRAAKSGKNKGKLCIMIPGTKRTAYVTREDMAKHAST